MKLFIKRSIILIFTLFIIAGTFSSCGGESYDIPNSTAEELKTVLYVGDYEVPYELYRYFFLNYKFEYDAGNAKYWESEDVDTDAVFTEIREKTLSAIHRCYATISLSEKYELDPLGKKLDKTVDETVVYYIENSFGDVDGYVEGLKSAHMTDNVFRFLLRRLELDAMLCDELIYDGVIKTSDEAVLNSIRNEDEFCHAKQILVKNDPGEDPAANYERAKEALNSASLGVDFDTLVAKYGEDPEMIVNPVGYYFTHNELVEEFEEAAFALKVGEMSGIVESYLGYHIILRCEIDPSYVSEYFDDLRDSYLAWKYQQAVEGEMDKLQVKTTDYLDGLTFADITD